MAFLQEIDDILNDLLLVANGIVVVNFDAKHEAKMHILHAAQRLIGEDKSGFEGSNTFDNYILGYNNAKEEMRKAANA